MEEKNKKKLTTFADALVVGNQNTMSVEPRGPVLIQDVRYLEKLPILTEK